MMKELQLSDWDSTDIKDNAVAFTGNISSSPPHYDHLACSPLSPGAASRSS